MSYVSLWLVLIPVTMVAIVGVDAWLGARAEYLNATAIAQGWWRLLDEGAVRTDHAMFAGADGLAPAARLVLGTGLWATEAAVVAAALALPLRWLGA